MSRPGKTERRVEADDYIAMVRTNSEYPEDVELQISAGRNVIVVMKRGRAARLGRMLIEAARDATMPD